MLICRGMSSSNYEYTGRPLNQPGCDAFDPKITDQRRQSLLASETALFGATERCCDTAGEKLVNENLAGVAVTGESQCPIDISGVYTGDQPEVGAVGDCDSLFR